MIIDPHSVKGGSRHDCRLDYKNREYSRRLTIVIQIIIREFKESDPFHLTVLSLRVSGLRGQQVPRAATQNGP
jgi:hypothetical protein